VKISIITASRNNASSIDDTLESIGRQTYSDWEHLIVDGGSTDGTLEVAEQHADPRRRLQSEPDEGVYDAMNKGIARATGDVIGFLNADDFYTSASVLESIATSLENPERGACFADLVYVSREDPRHIVRNWTSGEGSLKDFARGKPPAHPTFYARAEFYTKFGGFDLNFPLAADFELLLRFLVREKIPSVHLDETWVSMRLGGITNRSLKNVLLQNAECFRAFKANGLRTSPVFFLWKLYTKVVQFSGRSSLTGSHSHVSE